MSFLLSQCAKPGVALLAARQWFISLALVVVCLANTALAGEKVTVNFREADIRAVIESVAELTGRSFILDPRVQGKVTIVSPDTLDSDVLYDVVLSALQVHGFQAVEDGAVTRIVPFTQSFQLSGGSAGHEIATSVISTHYLKASELLPTLKPMASKGALIQAHDASNTLIVTDTRSQIERIKSLVKELDSPAQSSVDVISLRHISAGEALNIASQLNLFKTQNISIVEDVFNNRLIISGSAIARKDLKRVIAALDVEPTSSGSVEVIRLNFSQAESMKPILENLLASSTFVKGVQSGEQQKSTYRIEADTDNNALIIAASPDVVNELRNVVRKLDVPRRQVLIEAIVAEISEDQARNLTVQLAAAGREGGAIINFNDLLPALLGAGIDGSVDTDELSALPFSNGILAGGASWNSDDNRGFGVLIEALKSDANTNILSTPSVVTLDNQLATISVGQEVPFITGSYVSSNNSVSNPFQTIEREEIGVKLTVRPQINEGNVVRMSIEQETSNLLSSAAASGTADVITAKRLITTNVLVGDSEFLVLGGLIDDAYSNKESRVPVLGDIPVLGHLFRSRQREKTQSVLMVFIRPTIIDTYEQRQKATGERYRYLQQRQSDFGVRQQDKQLVPMPESIDQLPSAMGQPVPVKEVQ